MKTPEEMAEEYRENHDECEFACDAFLAGYKAAKAIVEEELQTVQAQRAEPPTLEATEYALKCVLAKAVEYALKNVLAKMRKV